MNGWKAAKPLKKADSSSPVAGGLYGITRQPDFFRESYCGLGLVFT